MTGKERVALEYLRDREYEIHDSKAHPGMRNIHLPDGPYIGLMVLDGLYHLETLVRANEAQEAEQS